ncbi:AbrB/MazE/SpoVT family DNA-binding domain-containing protein [Natronorubrum texcoconense]|uniref:Looped-hinge helix DNA binding domain-containing protein, AbrB family n=1 Tax=Natronorubrum texcoconense TaxID=1095776 RepID=A0A1G9FDN6_9EURY|nr:AbrB/MazE/SpoVT family DNA-binding domain-containing protein [Natronorubrum texcoconense]SDK86313.1 looped-hinge helix DNA binding domain-containing protein, AbrB family [Natronorubrum texcoconense]
MSTDGEDRRIDGKGRVTIPQRIREQLNLEPGERVSVGVEEGAVVVRPRVSRSTFIESMRGCITAESKAADAPEVSPGDLKADWTSDLPNEP